MAAFNINRVGSTKLKGLARNAWKVAVGQQLRLEVKAEAKHVLPTIRNGLQKLSQYGAGWRPVVAGPFSSKDVPLVKDFSLMSAQGPDGSDAPGKPLAPSATGQINTPHPTQKKGTTSYSEAIGWLKTHPVQAASLSAASTLTVLLPATNVLDLLAPDLVAGALNIHLSIFFLASWVINTAVLKGLYEVARVAYNLIIGKPEKTGGSEPITSPAVSAGPEISVDDPIELVAADGRMYQIEYSDEPGPKWSKVIPKGRLIGQGGTADVYLAIDKKTGSPVALKIQAKGRIGGQEDEAAQGKRLAQEYEILQSLRGLSNFMEVFQHGVTAEGRFFFSMPYFAPQNQPTLGAFLKAPHEYNVNLQGEVYETVRTNILLRLSESLNLAAERGIFHRDIKLSNIFISIQKLNNGRLIIDPIISDLGMAKDFQQNTVESHTGLLMGTAPYMAPYYIDYIVEKKRLTADQQKSMQAKIDRYALGVVAYKMLTGASKHPFAAYSDEGFEGLSRRVKTGERPTPDLNGIPDRLKGILLKLLALNPQEAYESYPELIRDLRLAKINEPPSFEAEPVTALRTLSYEEETQRWFTALLPKVNPDEPKSVLTYLYLVNEKLGGVNLGLTEISTAEIREIGHNLLKIIGQHHDRAAIQRLFWTVQAALSELITNNLARSNKPSFNVQKFFQNANLARVSKTGLPRATRRGPLLKFKERVLDPIGRGQLIVGQQQLLEALKLQGELTLRLLDLPAEKDKVNK